MRVGIDGHMIGDHSGGNESYYTNILLNMNPTKNLKLILFLKKGVDDILFKDKYQIVRFEEMNSFKRNFIELPNLCKQYNLDLLHTQYFIPFYRPCPVVCTIHDICFEHYKNIFTKKEYFRQKILIPYAAKNSEFVFTVSKNAKKDIIKHYKINEKKVIVTYNAVDTAFRKLNEKELNENQLRKKFNIGKERYILSVGNLQPRKNLPRLIRAFIKSLTNLKEDTKLVIVGKKAWMFEDIIKEACNDNDRIIFTDYVSKEDLIRLYNAATCFVYPSFFEGFGIPPLEAMACGTPVAVANKTSLPEVVGNAGIFFNPFSENEIMQGIITLLDNDDERKRLIELGFKRVKKYSWSTSARVVEKTYKMIGNRNENFEKTH